MPKLPSIQSQGQPGSLNLPRPTSETFGGGVARAVGDAGATFAEIGHTLQAQQDELDFLKLKGEYEDHISKVKLQLQENPNYEEHETEFDRQAKLMQSEFKARTKRRTVQKALDGYFATSFPKHLIAVRENRYRLQIQGQAAELDRVAESLSAEAARGSEQDREGTVITFEALVDRAQARGILDPLSAENKRRAFRKDVQFGAALQAARIDPVGTLKNLAKDFPLLDAREMETIISRAMAADARAQREADKQAADDRDSAVLEDFIRASRGELDIEELEERARRFGYTDEDFGKIRNEIERGGVTAPATLIGYELDIRSGRSVSFREIADRKDLSAPDKIKLFELVNSQSAGDHFTKTAEYGQAVKELRIAVSRKGPFESLDPQENKLHLFVTRELYDRVAQGEDPLTVSRELQKRIPEAEGSGVGTPRLNPKYETEDALIAALISGEITRDEFNREAIILDEFLKGEEEKQRRAQEAKKKLSEPGRQ